MPNAGASRAAHLQAWGLRRRGHGLGHAPPMDDHAGVTERTGPTGYGMRKSVPGRGGIAAPRRHVPQGLEGEECVTHAAAEEKLIELLYFRYETPGYSVGPDLHGSSSGVTLRIPSTHRTQAGRRQKSSRTSTKAVELSRRRPKNDGVGPRKMSPPTIAFKRSVIEYLALGRTA